MGFVLYNIRQNLKIVRPLHMLEPASAMLAPKTLPHLPAIPGALRPPACAVGLRFSRLQKGAWEKGFNLEVGEY